MTENPSGERTVAGRYRLLSRLGEGGMGTVWRARDEVLHREVAVKEVRAPAGLPAPEVERLYARLEREGWAAARVANSNVVTVYDVATEDGRPWIVMELIRGLSLADVLEAEGPMDPRRAAHIGAEVLSALRAAHAAGVLHRDVKPGNVLIANDGRVVLTDFGIAMVEGSAALTMTGEVIGSPEFLAPERALGRKPGPESDLWSLGVMLYAAVEGSSPFRQNTPLSTLRAIVDEELPPPRRAGVLTPVIEGLLRKDPAERLEAERAEQDLRIVAAGGTVGSFGPATAPLPAAPTIASHQRPEYTPTPPRPPVPVPAGAHTAPTSPTGPVGGPPGRQGYPLYTKVMLIVGIVFLALALGGLIYALMNNGDGGGNEPTSGERTSGGAQTTGSDDGGTTADDPGASESGTDAENGGTTSEGETSGGQTSQAPQSVKVTVAGARTDYSGSCPPQGAEAPAFTATFTVGRVPASVDYRWVTRSGEPSDAGWKTLSFGSGDGRTKQVNHVETTYDEGGTYQNEIAVEVRSPVATTSNYVAFSVSCETATPTGTGGASSAAPYGGASGATPNG
ncbi:serine/threonine-protein kinase [Streptomyces cavernae]|uniref:serine/threonine-protein kinase n=1 Tax=Streptomyces cavernae TaxID=2259034 RepID=UPI000FEB9108|nr:serine/threonine-protein kinase [Streptomyces cavernae]